MVIKCSKGCIGSNVFIWVFATLSPVFMVLNDWHDRLIPFIIAEAILQLCCIRAFYVYGKTIIMDECGCTVKFLFFKKRYSWDELKTKCIESYDQRLMGRNDPYKKGVVFSSRKNFHTPSLIAIQHYLLTCLNPFHFFVVLFAPPIQKFTTGTGVYEVDEKEFMEKMLQWGIVLTEC